MVSAPVRSSFEEEVREAGQWRSWVNSLGEAMASRHFMDFRNSVTDAAAEAQSARNTAEQVESALTFLESEVTSLETYASGNQFRIGDTGVVSDLRAGMSLTPEEKLIREGIKRQIEQTVTEVVRSGREIETLAADGLRAIVAGKIDDGGADSVSDAVESRNDVPSPPPQDAPAEQSVAAETAEAAEETPGVAAEAPAQGAENAPAADAAAEAVAEEKSATDGE